MWRYEDKGARPEGRRRSVWTSAGPHGSRTQAGLAINMDVHQAPCPLPPGLPLCAATGRRCQRIALAARWPPPAMPRSLINILRWRPISRSAAGRTNGVHGRRRPLAVYRQKTEKFGGASGETAVAVRPPRSLSAAFKADAGVADGA